MNKKKYIIIVIIAIMVIAIMIMAFIRMFPYPLRESNDYIRERILELTPIGSSIDEVLAAIEANSSWRIAYRDNYSGYVDFRREPGDRRIGEMYISADLGRSSLLWDVRANWGFDENGILIDVYIKKLLRS